MSNDAEGTSPVGGSWENRLRYVQSKLSKATTVPLGSIGVCQSGCALSVECYYNTKATGYNFCRSVKTLMAYDMLPLLTEQTEPVDDGIIRRINIEE